MDSAVQSALMNKAKKIFGNESTFLSFPVTPIVFNPSELNFFDDNSSDGVRETTKNLERFSQLVNFIPESDVFQPVEGRYLWDEYEEVLSTAILDSSTRTDDEERVYQQAKGFLHRQDEHGDLVETSQYLKYKAYKDQYIVLQEHYQQEKLSAYSDLSHHALAKWQRDVEPAMVAEIEQVQLHWQSDGFKTEIETAKSEIAVLGAKSPFLTWRDWQSQFSPETNAQYNAVTQSRSFHSTFSPNNALDEENWLPFNLSQKEICALNESTGISTIQSEIDHLTFEFSSAAIDRGWFDPQVFKSRFWHLPDPTKQLSNGENPPAGDCPAYITGIVFARNIQVKKANAKSPLKTQLNFNILNAIKRGPTKRSSINRKKFSFSDEKGKRSWQGWHIISQNNTARGPRIMLTHRSERNLLQGPVISTRSNTDSGKFNGDAHHTQLVVRSPSFKITSKSPIVFESAGGNHKESVTPSLGVGRYNQHAIGVVLVESKSGRRVMSIKTAQGNRKTIYKLQTDKYLNNGKYYHIEVVDNFSGAWGYVEWDNFSIPHIFSQYQGAAKRRVKNTTKRTSQFAGLRQLNLTKSAQQQLKVIKPKMMQKTKGDTSDKNQPNKLNDEIHILAFICKKLPQCPNPIG